MKKLFIIAAAALLAAACAKTYEVKETTPPAIGFGSWSDVMTKAPKTAFADGDEFDVFGYKWMDSGTPASVSVFEGIDVEYDETNDKWTYAPLRYWDKSFDNYTFFAVWPKDILASGTYADNGLFVTTNRTFNGEVENLLIAQKKDVAKANYGATAVPLVFKHMGALVDFKVKKSDDILGAILEVTSIQLNNIRTVGTFTVNNYDGSGNPVGTAGVGGWTPDATPTVTSFTHTSGTGASLPTLAANTGNTTGTAGALINNLVVMPQAFATGAGAQTVTIAYKLTDPAGIENTFTPDPVEIGTFDSTDNDGNTATFIASWLPGYHYTYYITINANAITFSASIAEWDATANGFHYLIN